MTTTTKETTRKRASYPPPLDPALIPARLKWLTRVRYSLADTTHERHPTNHPFVQELHGARWLTSTDGSTLVLARLADDELEGAPAENLLTFDYPTNKTTPEKRKARSREFIKWLTPSRPTAVVDLDRLREWATGSTEVVGVACPLCKGSGHNPFVEAGEAASRLGLYFDEGDFEYFRDIKSGRVFGVLFDRTRLGEVLKYVESDATRSCGVIVRPYAGNDASQEPALIYTDAYRVLVMPMRDPEPSSARANGDYFPTAMYTVGGSHYEGDDPIDSDAGATRAVLDLDLDLRKVVPAVPAPARLRVTCAVGDERLVTLTGDDERRVVAAMSASGGWFVPACLSAQVTAIVGGKRGGRNG